MTAHLFTQIIKSQNSLRTDCKHFRHIQHTQSQWPFSRSLILLLLCNAYVGGLQTHLYGVLAMCWKKPWRESKTVYKHFRHMVSVVRTIRELSILCVVRTNGKHLECFQTKPRTFVMYCTTFCRCLILIDLSRPKQCLGLLKSKNISVLHEPKFAKLLNLSLKTHESYEKRFHVWGTDD